MPRLVRHDLTGAIKIEPQEKAVWVCGCGLSKTFPYCDKAHKVCRDESPDHLYVYDPETGKVIEKRPLAPSAEIAGTPPGRSGLVSVVMKPFERFFALEAAGGILLLAAAVIALAWANSPWWESYFALWKTPVAAGLGAWTLEMPLSHWVNDALMTVFFFVVGLEIKRELLQGQLASMRRAALPIAGAFGGMAAPALIYVALNLGASGEPHGWGVPMATDIAFVVGALALLGKRAPLGLRVFLVALAIVDDMGAVLVIALFYASDISGQALGAAAGLLALLIGANLAGVRRPLVYGVLGVALWFAMLNSGVHATVAGVLLAMTIPARPRLAPMTLVAEGMRALNDYEATAASPDMPEDEHGQGVIAALEDLCEGVQSPLQRMEHAALPWSSFLVMPVFALANAGVRIPGGVSDALTSPVGLGVALGLTLGKPLGITLASWGAVRAGLAALPEGVSWRQLHGAGWLGGIGFTMSLFIAQLAFGEGESLNTAKLAILVGSLIAAAVGVTLLLRPKR